MEPLVNKNIAILMLSFLLGISMYINSVQSSTVDKLQAELIVFQEEEEQLTQLDRELDSIKDSIAKYGLPIRQADELAPAVLEYAYKYNVDSSILLSQIYAESAFNQWARSKVGARGLMQVMPFWIKDPEFRSRTGITTTRELYTVRGSIEAGAYVLSHYIELCGGLQEGLRCYHGGPGAKNKPRASTIIYVDRVMKYYRRYI